MSAFDTVDCFTTFQIPTTLGDNIFFAHAPSNYRKNDTSSKENVSFTNSTQTFQVGDVNLQECAMSCRLATITALPDAKVVLRGSAGKRPVVEDFLMTVQLRDHWTQSFGRP